MSRPSLEAAPPEAYVTSLLLFGRQPLASPVQCCGAKHFRCESTQNFVPEVCPVPLQHMCMVAVVIQLRGA